MANEKNNKMNQFADYMWMGEMEAFDHQMEHAMEEEEFIRSCIEQLLEEEEERDTVYFNSDGTMVGVTAPSVQNMNAMNRSVQNMNLNQSNKYQNGHVNGHRNGHINGFVNGHQPHWQQNKPKVQSFCSYRLCDLIHFSMQPMSECFCYFEPVLKNVNMQMASKSLPFC